ncbi:MAG: ACT domain-containing protein [bacterium]
MAKKIITKCPPGSKLASGDEAHSAPTEEELRALSADGSVGQDERHKHRAIISVLGRDHPGIVATIAEVIGRHNCNIEDISQTIIAGYFSMIIVVDISGIDVSFAHFKGELEETGERIGCKVLTQREEIFQYMHRI